MNKEAVVEGAAVGVAAGGVAAGLRQRKGDTSTEDVEAGDDPDAPFEIARLRVESTSRCSCGDAVAYGVGRYFDFHTGKDF